MRMVDSTHSLPSLRSSSSMDTEEREASSSSSSSSSSSLSSQQLHSNTLTDFNLGFKERAISAGGAAVLSAIIVNPLDVAKTRLQAQAAGVSYSHRHPRGLSNTYIGTLDVFYKVIRQEGVGRLWRGTNAALALAIPTVGIYLPCYDIFRNWIEEFTTQNAPFMSPYGPLVAGSLARSLACISCYPIELARTRMQAFKQSGVKPPGVWKTLIRVATPIRSTNNPQIMNGYRLLWTGVGAQLARDVPFSAICWSTLEPIRRHILGLVRDDANAATVLGANFCAAFVAGSFAAAVTCPLDVAKTRRQIEKDPARVLNMTTWKTLVEVWREGRMKGLFMGVAPRVARAGPSTGIVVSFYEVVKFVLNQRHSIQ